MSITLVGLLLTGCAGAAGSRPDRGPNGNLPFPIASSTPGQTGTETTPNPSSAAPAAPSSAAPAAPSSAAPVPAAPVAPSSAAPAPAAPSASAPTAPQGQAATQKLPPVTAKAGSSAYCQPLAQALNTLRQANTPGQGVEPEALREYSALMNEAVAQAPEALKEGLRALAQGQTVTPSPQALGAVEQGAQKDCGFSLA